MPGEEHMSNSQLFKKYRFGEPRPLSDRHIACTGALVAATTAPSCYYNGWYPVRRHCSFEGHEEKGSAGIHSFKDTSFRNYRVFCDVCDHPSNRVTKAVVEEPCCELSCNRTSVAPKRDETKAVDMCGPISDTKTRSGVNRQANTYWRYHDPHFWQTSPKISSDALIHKSNWLKEEMRLLATDRTRKYERRREEMVGQLQQDRKRRQLAAELFDQQKALKEQQKKCSFNNPLEPRDVPLPAPPTISVIPPIPTDTHRTGSPQGEPKD